MTDIPCPRLWWEEIPGARRIMVEIITALKNGNSVAAAVSGIPWHKEFRAAIIREMQEDLNIFTYEINGNDYNGDPGECLLKRFGKPEDVNRYRKGIDPPLPEYIRKLCILEKKLVCISGVSEDSYSGWLEFIKACKAKKAEDGIFFIETSFSLPDTQSSGKVSCFNIMPQITFYDVLSFSMFLVSGLNGDETGKHYSAWAASLFYEKDVEQLSGFVDTLSQNGISRIHELLEEKAGSTGRDFRQILWRAQLQIVFPVIEKLRLAIIARYRPGIEDFLVSDEYNPNGKPVSDPLDSELGFMAYIAYSTNANNKPLFPYDTYQDILFLRDCRNKLAHLEFCDFPDIDYINKLNTRFEEEGRKQG